VKTYPTIPSAVQHGTYVYVFDKLDGSQIRAEWTRKKGWAKFGRRGGLLDDSYPLLSQEAPVLFMDKYAEALEKVFRKQRWDKAVVFCEFWGPNSFAGNHEDETHDVTLFDVAFDKKGLLEPRKFLKIFGHLDHSTLLAQGNFTKEMQRQVTEGTLPGMTFEGVVAKGAYVSPGRPLMFKWKSAAWLDRLKDYCGENETLFRQLA
jgi:hypothetical protein